MTQKDLEYAKKMTELTNNVSYVFDVNNRWYQYISRWNEE